MPYRAHASPRASSPLSGPSTEVREAYELRPISPRVYHDTDVRSDDDNDADDDDDDDDAAASDSYALYTPTEDARVRRKLDTKLVLFLALLYALSFLDRSNIGNARIAGLARDLRLTDTQYAWLLWAFYLTYIAFEPMTLLYRVFPAHAYIAACIAAWGLIASVQATVTSFGSLAVLRALLGVSEAAFGPGVPFYLSFFFRREELALRTGLFISASPLSASFAGLLAWLITKVGEKGPLSPWRLLFLIEGFPSVLVAVWAWDFIPDGPGTARWLSPREREVAVLRLKEEESDEDDEQDEEDADDDDDDYGGPGEVKKHKRKHAASSLANRIHIDDILATLKDPKCYLTALMFFCANVAFSSMPVFLPTILRDMGHTALTAQALSAPPYLFAFAVVLLTAYLSDRHQSRAFYIILHALLAAAGYATIALTGHFHLALPTLRYLALYPATSGFFAAITITITWTVNNHATATAKGTGVAIMNVIGQTGPLLGTSLFPASHAPWYTPGMSVCAAAMLLVALLAATLRWHLGRENKRFGGDGGDGGRGRGRGRGGDGAGGAYVGLGQHHRAGRRRPRPRRRDFEYIL